jgi:Calcineurin-like phosphoesterase
LKDGLNGLIGINRVPALGVRMVATNAIFFIKSGLTRHTYLVLEDILYTALCRIMDAFFLIGCWNNDNCSHRDPTRPKGIVGSNDGRDYRRAVLEDIAGRHYSFGLVAGDNIYPRAGATTEATTGATKGAEAATKGARITKHYYSKTLRAGWDLLKGLGIPYYTVLGNHDVVKEDVLKAQLRSGTVPLKMAQVDEVIPGKLRLVRIDTNVLQLELTEPTKLLYGIKNAAEGWGWLQKFLEKVADTPYAGWTIVMGHEPLMAIKASRGGGAGGSRVVGLVYYKELLETISRIKNCVYVCADYHAFQVSQFSLMESGAPRKLWMVVAGTGGANPDPVPEERGVMEGKGVRWEPLVAQPAFGHCEGRVVRGSLVVVFHPLKHCSPNQATTRVIFRKKGGVEIKQIGRRIPYHPEKCSARETAAELCSNRPIENPRLEGRGTYVRREYYIPMEGFYQKK